MMPRSSFHVRGMAILLSLVLAGPVGCRPKGTPEKKASAASAAAKPEASTAPTPGPLSEAAVSALLEEWLAAQNAQNFDAYAKLYAEKFMGTKRAAARIAHFDRKGWLEDRSAMFKKEMVVSATERQAIVTRSSADVQFIQRWKSGAYEDVGAKRLLIVVDGGALRIAREEMLASEVVGSVADLGAGSLSFVVDGGIYLPRGLVPSEHGTPQLMTSEGADPVIARASVQESSLDGDSLAWKGQKVRVDDSCEATVTGFHLISRVTHHFGTLQAWHCEIDSSPCTRASSAEMARESFEIGRHAVIAELDACHDGRLVRRASEPRLIRGNRLTDAKLEQAARAAFSKLPEVVAQREVGAKNPEWWVDKESVAIFEHPVSRQVLVSVSANNRGDCGAFYGRAWQVWEVGPNGLIPVSFQGAGPLVPMAFDLDGDGSLELLARPQEYDGREWELVEPRGEKSGMKTLLSVDYAYNDCPC